jgi:predicted nuclease of restriction endonuclease-like (RecB) superfamily
MRGLSPRNLKYMRTFAAVWPDAAIVQGALAQIGWYQNLTLIDKLNDRETRLWYARNAARHGWSQPILSLQIEARLHERQGKGQNNFLQTLPPADSDLATQIFKDPYLFDFLGTADARRESEVEQALIDHIQKFLLELGAGFAFVGRQVHLEVGDQDFYLDLLFYHLKLRRYVVVELKARSFKPGDAGQINLYLSAADDLLRHPDDQPTIGLLPKIPQYLRAIYPQASGPAKEGRRSDSASATPETWGPNANRSNSDQSPKTPYLHRGLRTLSLTI